jgi:hypothetical protein
MTERTTRFGTLKSVTPRKTKTNTPYLTFELQCKGFVQTGATFMPSLVTALPDLVGKPVWMAGILDPRTLEDGRTVKAFKATAFKETKTSENA